MFTGGLAERHGTGIKEKSMRSKWWRDCEDHKLDKSAKCPNWSKRDEKARLSELKCRGQVETNWEKVRGTSKEAKE